MIVPILRSQSELLTTLNNRLRNTASRWTAAEIYASMNMALTQWQRRVSIPYVYTVPGGWVNGTHDYILPDYIEGQITPQALYYDGTYPYIGLTSAQSTWHDIQAYDLERNTDGGQTLRLHYYPPSMDGRVLWWGYNGPVPDAESLPTLNAGIDADDTSLTLATAPNVGRSGYVLVGGEWMRYAGVTRGSSTLTLNNLEHGVNDTAAASHLSGVSVAFGIAMDTGALEEQLINATRGYLMEHNLMNGNTQEAEHYEKQMLFYKQEAKFFWRGYVPQRSPKFKLTRMGIGI